LLKRKRRYRAARAVALERGFGVALDGEPLKTPAGRVLCTSSRGLAEAVAAEWEAQGEDIVPERMPFTRLANAATDRIAAAREATIAALAAYAESDLLCYRAEGPPELIAAEEAAWRPLLDWVRERFGAELRVTAGIMPVRQSKEAISRLSEALFGYDDMMLAALHLATTGCGSLVLALALAEGRISAAEALALAHTDEAFQAAKWGVTEDYAARRESIARDIASAARFMELCRA
jgi:chaperone required for assembly of F1-ATPase